MSDTEGGKACPDEMVETLIARLQQDEPAGISQLGDLLEKFRGDARLHFLNGSILAGQKDYSSALKAMRRAVDLSPDFATARFQLGFLLLTCGEPWPAQKAWGPLYGLPEGNHLLHFVRGLRHMIDDLFESAIGELERGIASNRENPPLNNDMRMIVEELRLKNLTKNSADGLRGTNEVSSAQLLLQQASLRPTRH